MSSGKTAEVFIQSRSVKGATMTQCGGSAAAVRPSHDVIVQCACLRSIGLMPLLTLVSHRSDLCRQHEHAERLPF